MLRVERHIRHLRVFVMVSCRSDNQALPAPAGFILRVGMVNGPADLLRLGLAKLYDGAEPQLMRPEGKDEPAGRG
jgi:hypothetical protein